MGSNVILVRRIGVLIGVLIVLTTLIMTIINIDRYTKNNSLHKPYLLAVFILSIISLFVCLVALIFFISCDGVPKILPFVISICMGMYVVFSFIDCRILEGKSISASNSESHGSSWWPF